MQKKKITMIVRSTKNSVAINCGDFCSDFAAAMFATRTLYPHAPDDSGEEIVLYA